MTYTCVFCDTELRSGQLCSCRKAVEIKKRSDDIVRSTLSLCETSAIIAELEKRRPCEKCEHKALKWNESYCDHCKWAMHIGDNFKEATK